MTEQVPERRTGIQRILRASLYSRDGIIACLKSEAAFRQEMALAVVMIPLAFFLTHDHVSRAVMIGSVFLVLIVELLNSAIEAVVNRFGPEWNSYSKFAKDAGSAAVLLSLVNVAVVWAICIF
jgi:diacylglycerol kinase (ATP)